MNKFSSGETFYKMFWFDFLDSGDLKRTVKNGFILYIVLAMVALPSALCSQQHRVIAFKIPVQDLPIEAAIDPISGQPVILDAKMADNDICPPNVIDVVALEKDTPPFHELIMQAAESYEVDPALIRAIIAAESSNNPKAVSHRGAQGLMQLMPSTAKSLGVADSFDPAMNIDGGVRYFKQLLDRFNGDTSLALAAYNAGSRYVRKYGGVPPFKATKRYIKKVLHFQEKYQDEMASSCVNLDNAV